MVVSVTGPPGIVTQPPANLVAKVGTSASITAVAAGSPAPSVQWQRSTDGGASFADIPGATSTAPRAPEGRRTTTLDLTPTVADDDNRYRAVFTNESGATTTSWTRLTVEEKPTITSLTPPQTALVGSQVTLTVAATGYLTPTVKWSAKLDGVWTTIPGATGFSYTTPPLAEDPLGILYSVSVSNGAGGVTASTTVYTQQAPVITTQPASAVVEPGRSVYVTGDFTSGGPLLDVHWERSTDGGATWTHHVNGGYGTVPNQPGHYGLSLSFSGNATNFASSFRAVVTNASGSATSDPFTISPAVTPTITVAPQPMTVQVGESATFSVATSDPNATVQWSSGAPGHSMSEIPGATSGTYTTPPLDQADDATRYLATITYAGGRLTTSTVAVTVQGPPLASNLPDRAAVAGQPVAATAATKGYPAPTPTWEVSSDGGTTWQTVPHDSVTAGRPTTLSTASLRVLSTSLVRTTWTNEFGTDTTAPWTLTVASPQPLAVTQHPSSAIAAIGSPVELTAEALGTTPPTVSWERRDAEGVVTAAPLPPTTTITGSTTSSTYTLTVQADDLGSELRAVFAVGSDVRTTDWASIRSYTPVVVTAPSDVSVYGETWPCFGGFGCPPAGAQKASFTAVASGQPGTVTWQVRKVGATTWTNVSGAATSSANGMISSSLSMTGVDRSFDDAEIRAVFANGYGTTTSASASFNVRYSPIVTAPPQDVAVRPGESATFTVAALGNPAPTIRWDVASAGSSSFTRVSQTGPTFTIPEVIAEDDGLQVRPTCRTGCASPRPPRSPSSTSAPPPPPTPSSNPATSTTATPSS
ncbi:MAG: hypothetical protein R2711_14610 [Acidimicrobiales bacterium]